MKENLMKKIESFKQVAFLTLSFIIIITLVFFANEFIRKETGNSLGYNSRYVNGFGRYFFYNEDLYSKKNAIYDHYQSIPDSLNSWKKHPQYLEYQNRVDKDLALIDLSGKLFTIFCSIISLVFYLVRRKRKYLFIWFDWLLLISSLIFIKEGVWELYDFIRGSKLCDECCLWDVIGIKWIYGNAIILLLSFVWFLYIQLFMVPKGYRLKFFISGFVGSIVGFFILLWYIAPYVFK